LSAGAEVKKPEVKKPEEKVPPKPEIKHPIHDKLKEYLKDYIVSSSVNIDKTIHIQVKSEHIRTVLYKLREFGYDFILSLSAIDYIKEKKFTIVYTLMSYSKSELKDAIVHVKIDIPRDNPRVSSVADIYPNADYDERECYEMFGIWFEGNPNMGKRFLLDPDCCPGQFPLRKDFKIPEPKIEAEEK